MKKQVLFFLLLANSFLYAQDTWLPLGPDDFTDAPIDSATCVDGFIDHSVDIAIDNNNVPYIVYRDGTNGNKATVRKFNGTVWETVGIEGFTVGEVRDPKITLDTNNVPYVAYSDGANAKKATVQKFNGTAWEVVGTAGFSVGWAIYMNIEISTNNVPYVAFSDSAYTTLPFVYRFNGTVWEALSITDLTYSSSEVIWTSMALDADNVPYLGFSQGAGKGRKYSEAELWEWLDNVPFSSGHAFDLSLDLNTNNVPYVIYGDAYDIRRALIKKFNGTTWEVVGSGAISDSESFSTGISIGTNNVPYVVYQNGTYSESSHGVTVQKFNGTEWEVVGTPAISAPIVGAPYWVSAHPAMTLDANNVPYVVYCSDGGVFVKYACSYTSSTDIITACDSYTWIDNVTYTASNNTATHTLTNAAGCDSVITLNLTLTQSTSGIDVKTACESYTWIDNITYTTSNNTATHTIANGAANGCDSIVTLNLTITQPATGIDVQTACESYTWIDNNTYTASNNTATHTIVGGATNGCDSIVTLHLTIHTVDVTVTDNSPTLIANNASASSYQWIDCTTNLELLGATNATYDADLNGNYAVILTENGCTDTSNCILVNNVSVDNLEKEEHIKIYPNPSNGIIHINSSLQISEVSVFDLRGQLMYFSESVSNTIDLRDFSEGVYLITIQLENGHIQTKRIEIINR